MRRLKKISLFVILLSVLLVYSPCVARAASGTITFTDPKTTAGKTVKVKCVVRTGGTAIGDATVEMKYDTDYLTFKSGDGVEDNGDGTLTYSASGDGSATELSVTMKFKAEKKGETTIDVTSHTAYLYSDETLTCQEGNSTVKIAAGSDTSSDDTSSDASSKTEATDTGITVQDKSYTFSEKYTALEIPAGFTETKLTYNGAEHKFVQNEAGTVVLGYLLDADKKGAFFVYNQTDSTFEPYVQIAISDSTNIILMDDKDSINLPSETYPETTMTVNGFTFPTWQDGERTGFYIVYALSSNSGEKGMYLYDSQETSYQRFEAPKEEKAATSLIGKLKEYFKNHPNYYIYILGAAIVLVLLFFIILIVSAVKLHHRNRELDDLYDEYGIEDVDDDFEESKKVKKSKKKKELDDFDSMDDFEEDEEDNYEDESELDYEPAIDYAYGDDVASDDDLDDDFDEDYEEDVYEDDFDDEDDEDYEDDFEDWEEEDLEDDLLGGVPDDSPESKDDDYTIDFIDFN